MQDLEGQLKKCAAAIEAKINEMKGMESSRESMRLCCDLIESEMVKESAKMDILATDRAFVLEGWAEADTEGKVTEILKNYCCAFEFSDPVKEEIEDVPVKLKNGPLAAPLRTVT